MTTDNEPNQDRFALILYGTETGTSQDLAEEVSRCLDRLHFHTDVAGLDDVSFGHLGLYVLTVFVVATTGQGDFPDNARKFWTSLLRKKLSSTTLVGTEYAVVGLGDSSYPKFNWAARKLDKRLRQLGATPIIESCEADEQGDESTDGAFLAWLPLFRNTVLDKFPLPPGQAPIANDILLPSKWRLSRSTSTSREEFRIAQNSSKPISTDKFTAALEVNDRVTPPDHWQDVRFMTLTTAEKADYMPGDALSIFPRNLPGDVTSLIERMNWHKVADVPIHFVSSSPSSNRNSTLLSATSILTREDLTLRILLTEHLDINAIPRRSFFGAIANYTSDDMHKERLLEFTDPQYLDEYYDYATRPRRSIIEILQEFDTVQLPWEEAANIFPALRPRQFSIASGGALKQTASGHTKFELLIAIVKYRTVIKRIREGVCTRYLAQLPVGTKLEVALKKEGRFAKAEGLLDKSHILIGAGTGIAPLRALIHEKVSHGHISGYTTLMFGCRNETADYFFRDEWTSIMDQEGPRDDRSSAQSGMEVITAFSRDQKSKVYVQDRIRERADLIWRFLCERAATVIVCGASGQMPKAVRQALVDALASQGAVRAKDLDDGKGGGGESIQSQEDAEKYLARLEKEGRYKQETWS
ncbi:uncharacterized protein A1O9_03428 [Exophiala aquamarina CBS 119918]|uniref:NADPH-dependent diflavin oxidoreductase 1 n=1 Tax=Exophiala aquamarina CBS 119918 TaxID=1182545 RepID=A0A072PQ60_9EURO|nr:uncharacterized protein A1O9_03428 [Exophiala aquamarina CBS 119918]KEF61857.1 hypothetical protein A1O9_03428 [Exophiala aquamarina CBS 119918]